MNAMERGVVDTMIQEGGSFVKALGQAFLYADDVNFIKLKAAFPDYWQKYIEIAALRRMDQQRKTGQ